jgi:hypothetical protein
MGIGLAPPATAQPSDALVQNYLETAVTEPPARLQLDPFYDKYTTAQGLPIVSSGDVPDRGLLVARDVVLHMLTARPDLQQHMIEEGYRVGVMADTDSTMDIPEYSDFEKPELDDNRLTEGERERYEEIREMTVEEYWNQRARGMGGKYSTCAEENILGYPGTKYFGENILVHEFSHAIHQAIREADPELAEQIGSAYRDAMANGLWEGQYGSTNAGEYFAEGTQFWFNSNYEYKDGDRQILNSADLLHYDPKLYKLLSKVYPSDHHIPMDVFYKHDARVQ